MSDQTIVTPNDVEQPGAVQGPDPMWEANVYDENGKLTHEGMREVINRGGSVLYGHAIIAHHKHLPTEAQVVSGDKRKSAALAASIDEQIAALQAQKDLALHNATADAHPGDKGIPTAADSLHPSVARGTVGEGDTAGADGDRSDPDSEAAKKAEAEVQAQVNEAKARQAANDAASEAAKSKGK